MSFGGARSLVVIAGNPYFARDFHNPTRERGWEGALGYSKIPDLWEKPPGPASTGCLESCILLSVHGRRFYREGFFSIERGLRVVILPLGVLSQYIFGPVLFLLSLFIIAVILLQRGKGGGLTGALGGLGGQSAFGVKAGDTFTRITAVAVLIWIFICALACRWYLPEKLDIKADIGTSSSMGAASPEPKADGLGVDISPPANTAVPPANSIESTLPEATVPPAASAPAASAPATESPSPAQQPVEPPSVDPTPSDKQP